MRNTLKKLCIILTCLLFAAVLRAQAPLANFTAVQTTGCAPLAITFQDQSTEKPTAWRWDFGNGATSTLQNPSTTFFAAGTYTVTLTVTNSHGSNSLTRQGYITIYEKPVVNLGVDRTTGCFPLAVSFTDASVASSGTSNISWQWDLGNGVHSTEQNPQTKYTREGNYNVSLRVTNDKGCAATVSRNAYIKIAGGMQVAFTNTTVSRCQAPFPVTFTNASKAPGTLTYLWDFGDGATSTEKDPTHDYAAPGTYGVSLIVRSSNGCVDTLRKTELVKIQQVTTNFNAPAEVCILEPATFTNASAPAPQSATWRFSDGSTASSLNTTKSFSTAGVHTIKLINNYGFCRDSVSKTITAFPRPKPGFRADIRSLCKPPLSVKFEDASTDAVSWLWRFGDGQTSNEENPEHTYTDYGNFTVTLIVTNSNGCVDSLRQAAYIQIRKPVISFSALPRTGCVPYTNTFAANINTVDNVATYLWTLGDGTTSTVRNPVHTYTEQGTYPVSLKITTSTGCTDSATINNAIRVGRKPVIDFTASPNPACAFQPVQFDGTATEADSWSWTFGGGGTANQQRPLHTFRDTGRYDVTLAVTNNGCRETLAKPAFVEVKAPISKFRFEKDCRTPRFFVFTDGSIGATSWLWDFGDGTTSTEQNPTHVFSDFRTYTVSLTVTNESCSHTSSQKVEVFQDPLSFSANVQEACRPTAIQFTSIVSNPANKVAYEWNFHNGTIASGASPTVNFTRGGSYGVTLVTTDIYGCKDSTHQDNFIRINGPAARFSAENTMGCAGIAVRFKDLSTSDGRNPITSRVWTYGDGETITVSDQLQLEHSYKNAGRYSVSLQVTDALGCKDTYQVANLVSTSTPKASFVTTDTLTCLGSTVQFSNRSSAQNFSSQWHFGDGQTGTGTNPAYKYKDTGTYHVRLKITDANGCADSVTHSNYVRVQKTVAAFSVSDSLGGCTPFSVSFTNGSGSYRTATWNFSNGTSTDTNPVNTFTQAGEYPVTLTVTGQGGCVDSAKRTIRVYPDSAIRISYTPIEGCKPVQLKATVKSPVPMNYAWDFGDGTLVNTRRSDTTHAYTATGHYIPRLIVSDSGNCVLPFSGIDTINVKGVTARFALDKTLLCDSGVVQFTDSTVFNDDSIRYHWSFGDGYTSTLPSPVHAYQQPGYYTVRLAAQTSSFCNDTVTLVQAVKVVQSPSIAIAGATTLCLNEQVTHTGSYLRHDTAAVQWQWQFPNGVTATGLRPPAQRYTLPGNYTIRAVAINSSGCTDTAVHPLTVYPLPQVTMPASMRTMVGTPVQLLPVYSPNVTSYRWSPADGLSCTTCPQPIAQPKFNTTYTVVATDVNGCTSSARVSMEVYCQNANVFVPNTFSPNGDGSNDVFYVRGTGLARVKSLRIFSRLGEVIFEKQNFMANDVAAGWDGTFKGVKLAPDTYIYQVDVFCDNNETIRFDGSITLIR